jgi:PAS domain S-box-containing protein
VLIVILVMAAMAASVPGQEARAILLLHSLGHDAPGRFPFDTAFARTVREDTRSNANLYIETLDPNRFGSELLQQTREYLRAKYARKNIAAVAVIYDEALAFLLDEHDPLFPTVPVAAVLLQRPRALPDRVAVILAGNTVGESLALALRVMPQARQIAIIDGVPQGGDARDALYAEVQDQIESMRLPVPVLFLRNLPLDELLARVEALPPDAILFFARHYIGRRGAAIDSIEAVREVTQVARAPLFVSTDTMIGPGGMGGVVIPLERMATDLAKLALRISGPGGLPIAPTRGTLVPMFDWRELRRWGIDERLLPSSSDIRFRELSLWDQYRWYVVGAASVALFQTGLILALAVQRAKRRRMELALRESEQRFRVMADTAPVLIWRSGTDKACDFFNKPWLDFRGHTLEQEQGAGWLDGVHPDDRADCLDTYVSAFDAREPFRMEYRLQRADGEYRWVLHIGVPRADDAGGFAGYIGSAIDITDRKHIEEMNQDLIGRLITVQEDERARIARDLHDDVSQQLAGVAILLSGLKRKVGKQGTQPEIDSTFRTLQERTAALAETIRTISHELHPGVLEHTGLPEALRRHCADLEEQHHVSVIFHADDHLDALGSEVALCLYRVALEALTNAIRHAHARTIQVQLEGTDAGVELRVDDDGIGFVVSERIGGGLGLRSIDERVRINRGQISVQSRPGRGTSLLVRIPRPAAEAALGRMS